MSFIETRPFRPLNHPPQNREQPVCPQYKLIEICSELAGVQLNLRRYCGHFITYADSIKPLSGFRGKKYETLSACTKVYTNLLTKYLLVSTLTSDLAIINKNSLTKRGDNLIPPNFPMPEIDIDVRRNVIKHWRDLLGSNSDIVVERPDELPDKKTVKEVLSKVEKYLISLAQIVKPEELDYWFNVANGCEQTPRPDEIGEYSIFIKK